VTSPIVPIALPRRAGPGEQAFVVLALLLSLGIFANLMITGPIRTQNMGMRGMQILWSSIYLVVLCCFFRRSYQPWRELARLWPFLVLLAFVLASSFWSQDPLFTLRRATALGLTFVFGTYFSSCFKLKEQFRLLGWAFAICIAFSFLFEILGLNPSQEIAGWYGVFYHKTELGRNCVLAAMLYLYWREVDPTHKSAAILGFCASVLLVVLSRDVTSIVTLVFLLISGPYLNRVIKWSRLRALIATSALIALGTGVLFFILGHLENVTRLLGKDPLLTGRVPVWILATVMALQRPWFGYGFDAFWLPDNAYVQRIWALVRWKPPHAHNGLLELWLELGIVGVTLFVCVVVYYCGSAIRLMRRDNKKAAAWPLVFFVFFFLTNLTESCFIGANSIYFVLFVASAFMCRRGLSDKNLSAESYA
jgi:exopolysaccharide production protein ExoQ